MAGFKGEITDETIRTLLENPRESAFILLSDFTRFVAVFHYYMYRQQFTFMPFHEKICRKFEDILFQRNVKKNLYIGIAPRYGKSQLSIYFAAMSYAFNKNCNFIYTSYGADLVHKFSTQIRNIVESELFQTLFNISLSEDTTAKELWKIEGGGEFRATTMSGVITGFGAGVREDRYGGAFLIDDYMKAQDYGSQKTKESIVDIYRNTIKSRRNNKNTPTIIIAQRLAKDDLIGWIQENEPDDWDFFVLPALDEETMTCIWEEKHSVDDLLQMKRDDPFLFWSQYQQQPIPYGGGMIKHEWWRFYDKDFEMIPYKRIFITADTAMKTNEWNDFTAVGVWGLNNNGLYLLDLLHGKFEAPELENVFLALYNKWNKRIQGRAITSIYIEDKASGTGLIQSLRKKNSLPILPIIPEADKRTRVLDAIPQIATGNVYLPFSENSDISKIVLAETDAFAEDMSHAHDDIVDMICYAIQYGFNQRGLF